MLKLFFFLTTGRERGQTNTTPTTGQIRKTRIKYLLEEFKYRFILVYTQFKLPEQLQRRWKRTVFAVTDDFTVLFSSMFDYSFIH